jgi:AcrR family transcriptional regulator
VQQDYRVKRNAYHHGDLRKALIDAATRLVRREGFARVSLREIAREAGVSHAAPYHHFEDREALLAEVAVGGFEMLGAALRAGAAGDVAAGPLVRLQGAGVAYVVFAGENPEIYRLMFGGLLSDRDLYPALRTATEAAFGVLLELLGAGGETAAAGAVNPVALATWSTVHGLASLLIEGLLAGETSSIPVEEIARQVTTVLGRGLRSYSGPAN